MPEPLRKTVSASAPAESGPTSGSPLGFAVDASVGNTGADIGDRLSPLFEKTKPGPGPKHTGMRVVYRSCTDVEASIRSA